MRPRRDHPQSCGRFNWADTPALCLAFAAAWYLSRYEHYSVPSAVATSAAALGIFTLAISAPKSIRRVTELLAVLGGTIPATPSSQVAHSPRVSRQGQASDE